MTGSVYAVATMDTKGLEIAYVAKCLRAAEVPVILVDVGVQGPPAARPDIDRQQVAEHAPDAQGTRHIFEQPDRGEAVSGMGRALEAFLLRQHEAGRVAGVLGIGGSGGTAIVTQAMRALPIGLPKLMVSTVASGNTAPYVASSDITMMYSVVDVAGLNAVSEVVLANAAHAMAGMVRHAVSRHSERPTLGMTMFGVTTPCVDHVREILTENNFECLVFHATGTGGQAMEKLVEADLIRGVLDITTTEVADEVVGGVFPAGPARIERIARKAVPYVLSVGALDMVNFGSPETIPEMFRDRKLHIHNPQVTLMRTTPDENRRCARWIAERINRSTAPTLLVIPEGGISALDAPGQPFYDPEADRALFQELEACVEATELRRVVRHPWHINDPRFAGTLAEAWMSIWS